MKEGMNGWMDGWMDECKNKSKQHKKQTHTHMLKNAEEEERE